MKKIMLILFGLFPASFALAQNGVNKCEVKSLTPASGEICASGTASFSASVTSGGTAEWSVSDTTAGDVDPKSGPSTVFTVKPGFGGQVTVTVKCGQNSSTNATVKVVAVQSLTADEGSAPGGLTNIVDWAESGEVTVTATPNPNIPPGSLPSCWQMTGGSAVSRIVHTVDKSAPGFTTIIAIAGTSIKTQVVAVVKSTFTAYARRGGSSSLDFGHGWWEVDVQPAQAKALVLPSGARTFVNASVGYACYDCETGFPTCSGQGNVWWGGANGSPDPGAMHTWNITFNHLQDVAVYSLNLVNNPGTFSCTGNSCVTKTIVASSVAVVSPSIPSSIWIPYQLADWLASQP